MIGPHSCAEDAVAWALGEGHIEQLDVGGRPLGERAASAYEAAPLDERHVPFGDSRDDSGLPCNHAALAQIDRCYGGVVQRLRSFGRGEPPTMARLARRVAYATGIGPLRALRGEVVRELDGALFKVTIGFSELVDAALLEGWTDADATPPPPEVMLAWCDASNWLIGDAQVCAGERRRIAGLWKVLAAKPLEGEPEASDIKAAAALRAMLELRALAAAAARAAMAMRDLGRPTGTRAPLSTHLLESERAPRLVRTVCGMLDAGALHPTLLFEPDDVPTSLRWFLETLATDPRADLDAALISAAREPMRRWLTHLGRPERVDVAEALRRSADPERYGLA